MLHKLNVEKKFLQPFVQCLEDIALAEHAAFQRGCLVFKEEAAKLLAEKNESGPLFLFAHVDDIRIFVREKQQWGWKNELLHNIFAVAPDGELMSAYWCREGEEWTVLPSVPLRNDSSGYSDNDVHMLIIALQNIANGWYVAPMPLLSEAEVVC